MVLFFFLVGRVLCAVFSGGDETVHDFGGGWACKNPGQHIIELFIQLCYTV